MQDLKGKTAVITGGANGIGLAMAQAFGTEGMRLVIADIEQGALDTAIQALQAEGYEAIGVRTDVARYADVEALAQAAVAAFGKVHVLVNNAGVSITGPLWDLSLDDWRWVYDVNVWGIIHGVKAFTQLIISHGEEGHIINTASEAALLGIGHHAPYCSSKAAALSISVALYSELIAANTRVGVSVVCPGMVDTQIHRSWRNRPAGDTAWSDRDHADQKARAGADAFQAQGVPPQQIAQVTLEALKANRLYVFNTPHWRDLIKSVRRQQLSEENPEARTWGPDLRPKPSSAAS